MQMFYIQILTYPINISFHYNMIFKLFISSNINM